MGEFIFMDLFQLIFEMKSTVKEIYEKKLTTERQCRDI